VLFLEPCGNAQENVMRIQRSFLFVLGAAAVLAAMILLASRAHAHCDGLDGPVVKAAQKALDSGDVSLTLVWVKADDEPAIRAAFQETLAVRKLSPQSKEFADRYFFETLVRIHRAGEGASYTGLKPAGRDLGPAIPAADLALETGEVESLVKLVTDAAATGIRERFQRARALRSHDPKNVQAGREFVEAYVTYVHYVEGCYQATQSPAHGHAPDAHAEGGHEVER
jgi:hypothetical protein